MNKAEEIANKYQMLRYKTPNLSDGLTNHEYYHGLKEEIESAAKEQSIAFARFIHEEEWVSSVDGDSDEKWWFKEDADDSYLTTDQLFQLFLDHKNKQP